MERADAEHDRNVIARQRDISCDRGIAGRGTDGKAAGGEADFQGKRFHGLAPVGVEALLGNPVMGDAAHGQGKKRREAFEFCHAAAAGEAQAVIIGAVGGDGREMPREKRDRRVVIGIDAGNAAIFHGPVEGVERRGDGGQAAGVDRLHVTERDVVGHGGAPGQTERIPALDFPFPLPFSGPWCLQGDWIVAVKAKTWGQKFRRSRLETRKR